MPDWFRRAVARLVTPEQCMVCGSTIVDTTRRRPYEAFCGETCAVEWDRWADERWL